MKVLTVVLAICMLSIIGCSNDNDAKVEELQQAQTVPSVPTAIPKSVPTPTPTPVPTSIPQIARPISTPSSTPTPTLTPTPKPTVTALPTATSTPKPFVRWSNWETGKWTPTSIAPECSKLEKMFEILPIDISFVDEFSSPGRPGGDNSLYLAHGYLRSNSTPHDQIQVKFPAEGFSLYAANRRFEDYFIKEPGNLKHIISTEEQVKLEFHHPCGIAVMLDHLAQVPEKWMKIIEDVPILKNSSVVTFMPPGQYFVESGEILSHAIGHETNTYMDFGVYDLRHKNEVAETLSKDWPEYATVASYGICWTELFGVEIEKSLKSVAKGSDHTSNFCK